MTGLRQSGAAVVSTLLADTAPQPNPLALELSGISLSFGGSRILSVFSLPSLMVSVALFWGRTAPGRQRFLTSFAVIIRRTLGPSAISDVTSRI
jgi:hypothetical protein